MVAEEEFCIVDIPPQLKDRRGMKYNMLTVVGFLGFKQYKTGKQTLWKCLCDCGNYTKVTAANLQNTTKSCGCWNKIRAAQWAKTSLKNYTTTHGLSGHKLYDTWNEMLSRCSNPKNNDYPNYGGRGIKVCARWKCPVEGIKSFIEDVGERPEGMTLDRVDVDGDYMPENCRWATAREQMLNTRVNLSISNVYRDRGRWKALFQLENKQHYVGMFPTQAAAKEGLDLALKEIEIYDR